MNQFPPAPEYPIRTVLNFLKIRGDIRKSRCTTGINDTGGKFPVSNTPAAKLPPVSTVLVANFATSFTSVVDFSGKFATGVNDTDGKFATGVNNAGGKLPQVPTTQAANLPPVYTTPVSNNGHNYQTADNLKWTWRKNFLYANSTT